MLGEPRAGKTALLRRHLTGEYSQAYDPTRVLSGPHPLAFYTTQGKVEFRIWEIPGCGLACPLPEYDAAIALFDLTDHRSYVMLGQWLARLREATPVVVCGNKADAAKRDVTHGELHALSEGGTKYFDVSARSNYNFEKPFLELARRLVHLELRLVEAPAVAPPTVALPAAERPEEADARAPGASLGWVPIGRPEASLPALEPALSRGPAGRAPWRATFRLVPLEANETWDEFGAPVVRALEDELSRASEQGLFATVGIEIEYARRKPLG